jgi:exopolysaccharide biosynthesis polyprenyl glycosylphosphotransferase
MPLHRPASPGRSEYLHEVPRPVTPSSFPRPLENSNPRHHLGPPAHSAERVREATGAAEAAERAHAAHDRGFIAWLLEGQGWCWLRPTVDAVMLIFAVLLALRWPGEPVSAASGWPLAVFPPAVMGMLALRGMYARRLRVSILDGVPRVVSAVSLGAIALIAAELYVFSQQLQPAVLVHLWGVAVIGVGAGRIASAWAQRSARSRVLIGRPTLIVGAGVVGTKVARRLQDNPDYGLRPIGFVDAHPPKDGRVAGLPVLGGTADVDWIASLCGAQHVVLAFTQAPDQELVELAKRCNELGLEVSIVPRLFEAVNDRFSYEAIGGMPLLALRQTRPRGRSFSAKHFFDRTVAGCAVAVLAPLLLSFAAAVKLTSRGPVLFRQRRVGRDGKEFDLLKFRSMAPLAADAGFALGAGRAPGGIEGIDRRTAVGRVMRRTSLDELPQLFNVLRGDMSLIGPRPERPEFVELFVRDVTRYDERHRVKSGITGWAQVHGLRGQTSLADRVEWDNYYIEHWSWQLDMKILALTVIAVLRRAE